MSPPIFNPDGSEVSEIVLPDGSTASQVIGPDGNVVFEVGPDIPDSGDLQARYDFSQEDGSTPVTDQTGNGHDLTGNYSGVGVDINGVQAGDFDGTDDLLQATFTSESQPNTIFAAFELVTNSGNNHGIIDGGTKLEQSLIQDVQDSGYELYAGSRIRGSKSRSVGDVEVVAGLFDGANSVLRFDGSQDATGDVGSDSLTGITLGGHADDSNYSNVKIGEVLVYPQDKSAIFSDVENYLIDKWGPV